MNPHVSVPLASLRASDQPRHLNTEAVDRMTQSLKEVGLIQPITVRPSVVMNGIAEDGYRIVAGHHRVAAARALGWTEIPAFVLDADADHLSAELIEIDENLCRAELTAAQRAGAIRRRKQIWEAMHPTGGTSCPGSLSDGRKAGPQHEQGFAAETAAVTGQSKKDINRHVARAEALGDDLNTVVGTSLDKGTELDALKKLPTAQRKALIKRAASGEQVSARSPRAKRDPDQLIVDFSRCLGDAFKALAAKLDASDFTALLAEVEAALKKSTPESRDTLAFALRYSVAMKGLEEIASGTTQAKLPRWIPKIAK